jgi:hypothetical protein
MGLPSHLRLRVNPSPYRSQLPPPDFYHTLFPFTSELRKNKEEGKYEVKGVKIVHYEGPDKKKEEEENRDKGEKRKPTSRGMQVRTAIRKKKEQIRNGGAT